MSNPYMNPTVAQFQAQFARDFPFGTTKTNVLTSDITSAFNMVNVNINPDLFCNQGQYTMGYNLLAAHYLVLNLRNSSQGISGQYNFLQQGKGVGSVSESFGIPEVILKNPYLSMLCKTNYGALYVQLIYPQLLGPMFTAASVTNP